MLLSRPSPPPPRSSSLSHCLFVSSNFLSSAQWLWFSCEPHELIRSNGSKLHFISSALTFFRVTIFSVFLLGQWFGFSFSFAHISYKCSTFFHRCQTLLFRKKLQLVNAFCVATTKLDDTKKCDWVNVNGSLVKGWMN